MGFNKNVVQQLSILLNFASMDYMAKRDLYAVLLSTGSHCRCSTKTNGFKRTGSDSVCSSTFE